MNKLVSIIIPNFNRSSLIGETLDSIKKQTYNDWECIIVDDGSSDNYKEIITKYISKDSRFQLHERPDDYPKGANSCRNIGMKLSKGDYVIFFDSDDLMYPNHIEEKVNAIELKNYDFIIMKSEYFNNPANNNPMNYRSIMTLPITADNYITKKINWITFDPLIKRSIAEKISFTEKKQSAEEYNYFVKLVLLTENACAFDVVVTKRRYHENSYQVNLKSMKDKAENEFYYYYDTFIETKDNLSNISKKFMLDKIALILYKNKGLLEFSRKELYLEMIKTFGLLRTINKIRLIEF